MITYSTCSSQGFVSARNQSFFRGVAQVRTRDVIAKPACNDSQNSKDSQTRERPLDSSIKKHTYIKIIAE